MEITTKILAAVTALPLLAGYADAHPHVFIDGGVDFVFRDETVLEEVKVTWLYDSFETLYILSSHGLSLNADGGLDEADRRKLIDIRSNWPSDFDGSVHLTFQDSPVNLAWPEGLEAHVINGRLKLTFSRRLDTPIDLAPSDLSVGFYESTYFFAFKVANEPTLLGGAAACAAKVIPFVPDEQDTALQATLAKLSREETPQDTRVGALLADRISIQCA